LYCIVFEVFNLILFFIVLDWFEEELFKARERIIEISIEKDHLFDSVSDLEEKLFESRKNFRKLQKQYEKLVKLHSKCANNQ
jgi:hypothetical protein